MSSTYYHINNTHLNGTMPIDIGHSVSNSWDIKQSYPYYCLSILVKGQAFCEIDGERKEINEGEMFIIPPNTLAHYGKLEGCNEVEIYWMNFNGLNCGDILNATAYSDNYVIKSKKYATIVEEFKKCIADCKNPILRNFAPFATLYTVINLLVKEYKASHREEKILIHYSELADQIVTLVNNDMFSPDFCETKVAKKANISPEHFSRIFTEKMGINFVSYVRMSRIKKASSLLEKTNLSIKEISYDVGFTSVYYFCNVFKKYRLMTPSQYRIKNKQN